MSMSDEKTPAEWAIETGHCKVRRDKKGRVLSVGYSIPHSVAAIRYGWNRLPGSIRGRAIGVDPSVECPSNERLTEEEYLTALAEIEYITPLAEIE